jgi:hypothetical protein
MPRHAGAAERVAGPTGEMGYVMPKVAGPAEKKAGPARGMIGLGVRGFGVCFPGVLRGLALGGMALGWALGVGGVAGACLGVGDGVKVRCRACRWACARGGSGVALEGRGGGVGGWWSPGRLGEEEGGGVVGERGTVAAYWVMVAMRSVRTLLWRSLADWGDTRSSPLPSVVALGSMTVAGGSLVGEGAGERVTVMVSSRTRTRLLMVSRIFSTVFGEA